MTQTNTKHIRAWHISLGLMITGLLVLAFDLPALRSPEAVEGVEYGFYGISQTEYDTVQGELAAIREENDDLQAQVERLEYALANQPSAPPAMEGVSRAVHDDVLSQLETAEAELNASQAAYINLRSQFTTVEEERDYYQGRYNNLRNPPPPPPPENEPMLNTAQVFEYSNAWVVFNHNHHRAFVAPSYFTSLGVRYEHAARFGSGGSTISFAKYSLVGEDFTTITGVLGHIDGLPGARTYFRVYGDGRLIDSFSVSQNMLPLPVELNISGVNILEFRLQNNGHSAIGFGEIMIR